MEFENLSDEELVKIIKSQDEHFNSALGSLYSRHYKDIYNFSKSILCNEEDAEDNVNDVFCKVFFEGDYIQAYKEKGSFKSWIFSVAHNIAVDNLKRKTIGKGLQDKLFAEKFRESFSYENNHIYSSENQEILKKELRQIGGIHSEIIYLREFFDMSYGEIADLLNIPSSSCRSRGRRAVDLLKTVLIEKYGEEQFLS